MKRLKGLSAIGFAIALVMLSGCANQGAAAGSPTRSAISPTPAATRMAARPTATSGGPVTGMSIIHTVQEGENLYRIARKYGTSVQAIVQANGLSDVTLITVGQKIAIPNIQATTEPEPTETPIPTSTPVPATPTSIVYTATPAGSTPTIDPNATPTPTPPPPDNVNGIKLDQFVIMPPAVQANVKQIFAKGQALGNNAQRFSKVGDSIIEHPHYMVKFDTPDYNLGQYAYLQDVLNYYRGSYGRDSLSVRRGLHSWSWNNPTWADKDQCLPDEGPIACEYRVFKPSVSFIVLGSNDVGVPDYFRKSMEALVQFTIDQGVIPIIVTKADRHEGDSNINNIILNETATKFNVPLLDFDAVAGTMPNRGIDPADGTHLTFYYAHDYSVPVAFTKGHAIHDLTSIIMLDKLWRLLGLKP
jgi:LysM repeat protein